MTASGSRHDSTRGGTGRAGGGAAHLQSLISRCLETIRSFNPVTHSIDTHIEEQFNNLRKSDRNADDESFIQQVVYGWSRQKAGLNAFISNFYADNAAAVSRADNLLYTVMAYLAIFRLDDMGFSRFKDIVMSQDSTKMTCMIQYLFNEENLWSCLRSDWMKVYDLTYVEDEVIAGLEKYLPQARDLMAAIHNKEQGAAAAAAAKEEERAASAKPKASTRPVSPNLSKQRLPRLPEPEKIEQNVTARPVPSYLDVTSLATIEQQRREKAEQVRQDTYAKYQDPELQFKFNETKGVRPIEEAKREVEQEFAKQLAFDSSFVNPVPDFNKKEAKVKLNTAAILREDALYKKQQEKDYNLLKNYEVELRDATEYYGWQREMKHRDHEVKLQQVVMRRELSRQSAVDAKDAVDRQKDHNRRVADMLREQAEAIVRQKEMQDEVRRLENQGQVAEIIAVREVAPKVAREKVEAERIEAGKRLREQLEEERLRKEEEDRLEEEARADRIMQLRALNTVHKKHIVVFDPTETSGVGLMGEMSYMEMKERMEMVRLREESREFEKRKDIVSTKEQKAKEMESKLSLINKYRKIKADSNREASRRRKEQEIAEKAAVEAKREVAAIHLDKELAEKREEKKRIALELAEEEERIKRQQQYLGAAKGAVDELIARQLLDGQERQIRVRQHSAKEVAEADEIAKEKDRVNREKAKRKEFVARLRDAERVETEVRSDKRDALEKQKLEMFRKKNMVKIGHEQTEKTREVVTNHNLYAKKISDDAYLRRTNAAAKTSNP